MKLILTIPCFVVSLAILSSCRDSGGDGGGGPKGKPVVYTANYPLFYFAGRIGGDLIDLKFPVPSDIDPAFWKPTDEDIAALQQADLIVMNGAGYSKWAENVSLPINTQIDSSKAFRQAYITETGGVTHSHGNGVVHSHDGIAFTTWLNLEYAHLQAEAIRDAFIKLIPEESSTFSRNAGALFADLAILDQSLRNTGGKLADTPLVASHPVYQYLAHRYGLSMESVHWEPEVVPDAKAMEELTDLLKKHPAKVMIWEGEPAAATVEKLYGLGMESIIFQPCGNRPDSGDWLSVMKGNLSALQSLVQ